MDTPPHLLSPLLTRHFNPAFKDETTTIDDTYHRQAPPSLFGPSPLTAPPYKMALQPQLLLTLPHFVLVQILSTTATT
jgi:hypothetical protein